MTLEKVIADSGVLAVYGDGDIEITSVCNDSRKAAQGSLFVAVRGFASDGHDYIGSVVEKGAVAIVCEDLEMARAQIAGHDDITLVHVSSSRHALAVIAANTARFPPLE